ncbi:hypothetical protein LG634_20475 [Streptomyces bambusae]|uniref:hypothetical protein n=1 Tax=Streptomyces bambusae TaxID=1550616 RepID=UPI001CFF1BDC|nr:hypothetical protein [Streptomyces bambusae]MCB5167207.1 hypothetical protein [Streptomyces bambusae]
MGWTVLYIAFGFVALWLLAEVLLQNKARLRWRLLAFVGFVGVVAGVLLPSVLVIGIGAAAFAVGQTLVTLSFRRGFEAGWALRKKKKAAAAKRRGGERPAREEPALQVTAVEYGAADEEPDVFAPAATGPSAEPEATAAFPSPFAGAEPYGEQQYAGSYQDAGYYDPQQPQAVSQDPYGQGYAAGYDYDTAEQPAYTGYQDPYQVPQADPQGYGHQQPPGGYQGAGQDTYQSYQDPYTSHQYAMDTPPGGVWVPPQRQTAQPYPADGTVPEQAPAPGQEQQGYPYQGTGEYEQYRY